MKFLARFEVIPPHLLPDQTVKEASKDLKPSCITGGVDIPDPLDLPREVLRELKEEAGYVGDEAKLVHLGAIRQSKIADTIVYLFAINLTGVDKVKITGDGSKMEKLGECRWITEEELIWGSDPLMPIILTRFKDAVNNNRKLVKNG